MKKNIKIYSIIFVIMIILSSLFVLSVNAANYPEIPDDLFIDPRPFNENVNWTYVEAATYNLDGTLATVVQSYFCSTDKITLKMIEKYEDNFVFFKEYNVGPTIFIRDSHEILYPEKDNYTESYLVGGNPTLAKHICGGNGVYVIIEKFLYGGNVELYNTDNELITEQIGASELQPIIDDIQLGVKILLPTNNFSQSQIDEIVTTFSFKIPCSSKADGTKIAIKADGYIQGTGEQLYQEYDVIDGYAYGVYKIGGQVGFGEGREIKITVTDPYGKKWSDTVTVHCYEGYVDENSDGEDDRSFDDYWDSPNNPDRDQYNEEKPNVGLADLKSMLGGIKGFFEGLWGIIPQPIYIVLVGGIVLLIAVGILRAVLG